MADDFQPRWPRYGLRGDPFFSNALDPDEGTMYPIDLFHGRGKERKALLAAIADGDHSATLIYAGGGHGKTTLANAVCFQLMRKNYLVLPEEVQYEPGDGLETFFGRLLHGILQALSDRGHKLPEVPANPQDIETQQLSNLVKARLLVRISRIRTGWGGGLQAGLAGANVAVQYDVLQPYFEPKASRALLQGVVKEAAALEPTMAGILVRLNNLDVAASANLDDLERFFQAVRDLLQVPGMHFILMGNEFVRELLEGLPRVRTEFGEPLPLGPFSYEDVRQILESRYKFLRLGDQAVTPPVAGDLVKALHDIHYGDLRNILRDLKRCVQAVDPVEARSIEASEALLLLEEAHYRELDGVHISEETWETLNAIDLQNTPVRQTDLSVILSLTEAAVSNRFKAIHEHRLVELVRASGRSQFFRVRSNVRLALRAARRRGLVSQNP